MGRFGNVMLINGETTFSGEAALGEVVRLYLVNTANTRIFNFALPGAPDEAGRRRQRSLRARDVRRRGDARSVGAGGHRRAVRHPGRGAARAPHAGSRLRPRRVHRSQAIAAAGCRRDHSRRCASTPSSRPSIGRSSRDLERPPDKVLAFFSPMPLLYGGRRHAGDLLRLPDAPGGHVIGAGDLPEVRDEAAPVLGRDRRRPPTSARCIRRSRRPSRGRARSAA